MSGLDVSAIVEAVVRERFSHDSIQSVEVAPDIDDEGDAILRITVVLNGELNPGDKLKILGLVRHIRSELYANNKNVFPMVDFVSSVDAVKMRREVA